MNSLPEFTKFDPCINSQNAAQQLDKWLLRLENLFLAMDINNAKRKKALLLYYAGDATFDIVENLPQLPAEAAEGKDDYEICKESLKRYFKPRNNFEINVFKGQENI